MSRIRRIGAVVLAAVWALSYVGQTHAKDEVPYNDSVEGVFEFVGVDPDGNLILSFETVGQANQLGQFTSAGLLFVADDATFTGVNTLTAANGDQIFLEITSGVLTPTDEDGIFVIELETEFIDGTGRFVNVSGGFTGVGELDANAGTFFGDGEGTISPPGKNKKK